MRTGLYSASVFFSHLVGVHPLVPSNYQSNYTNYGYSFLNPPTQIRAILFTLPPQF